MKNIRLLITLIFVGSNLYAQEQGTITYEEKVKMKFQTEDQADMGDLSEHFPNELRFYKTLYFDQENSIYITDNTKKQDARRVEVNQESEGPMMVMKIDEPEEQVYCDIKNNIMIEKRDLMGRTFLIESKMDRLEWKLTNNQKVILGYPCQEAILKDSLIDLRVWFSPAIPVSTGPNGYSNLPGMILECERDGGKSVITAIGISLAPVDKSVFQKPGGGKKISKEDFVKISEEKRKEMQEENGGDGNIIIKIRN
ncbi:MAG TPA: GLPGLI family protein [Bacteroidia bacterium]|nr:GLPGLI family protein [Bacteroidia bacterium]HNS12593.1 GLPGLI family protein [Bacteroidia bacterium]